MSNYKIIADLELNTSNAESKFNKLKKGMSKIDSETFAKSMSKEMEGYRKLLNNRKTLERAYNKAVSDDKRKELYARMEENKKQLKKTYKDILEGAKKNDDIATVNTLKTLTSSMLGKDAFNITRPAEKMLKDLDRIGKKARENRDALSNFSGDISKKLVGENKKRNENVLKRLNDSKINENNREKHERTVDSISNFIKKARDIEKLEKQFDDKIRKERKRADELSNNDARKNALESIKAIEQKKKNLSLNREPMDIISSFKDLNSEIDNYSDRLGKISKSSKRIESGHKADLRAIEKSGQNVKKAVSNLESSIAKDVAKKLDLENKVKDTIKSAKKEKHLPNKLNSYKGKLDSYEDTINKLKKVDDLDTKVREKIHANKEKLTGFQDKNIQGKADKIHKLIEGAYKNIDKTSVNSTMNGLVNVDKMLSKVNQQATHLNQMDTYSHKIRHDNKIGDNDKTKLLSNLYQEGFKNVGSKAFDGSLRDSSMLYANARNSARERIKNEKEYQKALEKTKSNISKLKIADSERIGGISRSYVDDYNEKVNKLQRAIESKANKDNLHKFNNVSDRYSGQRKIIDQMISDEQSSGRYFSRHAEKLGGLSNEPSMIRGNHIAENMYHSYENANTGKLETTARNIHNINEEMKNTGRSVKQLSRYDGYLDKLAKHEQYMTPKDINKFRKQYYDLSQSEHLGTAHFDAELKRLNSRMMATSKYRQRASRMMEDFKSSFLGSSVGFMAGQGLRSLIGGAVHSYTGVDESLINIKKVAQAKEVSTTEQLRSITRQAIQVAKDVNASSTDVQNSIATSIQSGMGNMKSSIEVARKSLILSNVSDISAEDSTKAINTIVKSFDLNPLKKQRINVQGLKKDTKELANALDMVNYAGF